MNKIGILLLCLLGLTLSCKNTQTLSKASEQHRPRYHFTPPSQWMNDPNGLVYFEGEYHLFYQHYPDSNVWGPMHWGHAVSRNLVDWQHLPIALYPDSLGYIFSGSAVVDWNNTSGFGRNGKPPLVAIYTIHNMERERAGRKDVETQGIAYSLDKGRTWTKYAGNPVINNPELDRDFRDPKVIWHEPSKQWIATLAVGDHVEFWGSKDFKNWVHHSDFGYEYGSHAGVWECPDLFEIKVEERSDTKWVLLQNINPGHPNGGSGVQYFIGQFDGKKFTIDPVFAKKVPKGTGVWLDWGRDNYAGITWSDVPDGRRLMIGWMSNWDYAQVVPTKAWRSACTLPRELQLRYDSENGYHLRSYLPNELHELFTKQPQKFFTIGGTIGSEGMDMTPPGKSSKLSSKIELQVDLQRTTAQVFGVEYSNSLGEVYRIGYDRKNNYYFSDRTKAGPLSFSEKFAQKIHTAERLSKDDRLKMRVLQDVASVELFADDGLLAMTEIYFPTVPMDRARIFVEDGSLYYILINTLRVRPMLKKKG
jgi:fructan beta-fructosidase